MYSLHFTSARILGIAILLAAGPVAAQGRGAIDLGVFLGYNSFASTYAMKSAVGFGGRVGMYLDPRIGFELEANTGTAARANGLADRSFRFLDARLLLVPVRVERMSVLVGAGGSQLDADIDGTADDRAYAMHALVGGRVTLGPSAALRLDYTRYFNGAAQHGSLKAGLSFFRHSATSRPPALPTGALP